MGKGRDGMTKCVPVPGRIFNFHPYPFPSRTNWLFRHPVPCVPERLRFGSRPRPQRKKINIFITKYFVHQIWLLRLIWHLGSSYWVSNFKIPASLSVPLISIPIPYHPFFIFKFGSPSRPGMGRLNWIPSRPAAHLWFLPCCHIFILFVFLKRCQPKHSLLYQAKSLILVPSVFDTLAQLIQPTHLILHRSPANVKFWAKYLFPHLFCLSIRYFVVNIPPVWAKVQSIPFSKYNW